MYCQKCGKKINDEADFCPNCGKMVEKNVDNSFPPKRKVIIKEDSTVGIVALCSAVCFNVIIGIILAIFGLVYYNGPINRRNCKIAIGVSIAYITISLFIFLIVRAY